MSRPRRLAGRVRHARIEPARRLPVAHRLGAADLGGEVVYFAGDSLIAYWVADSDQNLGSAVRSAVACAEMICRSGDDRKHHGLSDIAPALHVGIGAGPIWAAALGENSLWNLIAGGAAITQAAASQAFARSWTYEMSVEAKAALAQAHASAKTRSRRVSDNSLRAPPPHWMASFLPTQLRGLVIRPNSASLAAQGPLAIDVDWSQHQRWMRVEDRCYHTLKLALGHDHLQPGFIHFLQPTDRADCRIGAGV